MNIFFYSDGKSILWNHVVVFLICFVCYTWQKHIKYFATFIHLYETLGRWFSACRYCS